MRDTVLGDTPASRATSSKVEGEEVCCLSAKAVSLKTFSSEGYHKLQLCQLIDRRRDRVFNHHTLEIVFKTAKMQLETLSLNGFPELI
jgi:hypothetical protein